MKFIKDFLILFIIIIILIFLNVYLCGNARKHCLQNTDNYNDYRFCLGI